MQGLHSVLCFAGYGFGGLERRRRVVQQSYAHSSIVNIMPAQVRTALREGPSYQAIRLRWAKNVMVVGPAALDTGKHSHAWDALNDLDDIRSASQRNSTPRNPRYKRI